MLVNVTGDLEEYHKALLHEIIGHSQWTMSRANSLCKGRWYCTCKGH